MRDMEDLEELFDETPLPPKEPEPEPGLKQTQPQEPASPKAPCEQILADLDLLVQKDAFLGEETIEELTLRASRLLEKEGFTASLEEEEHPLIRLAEKEARQNTETKAKAKGQKTFFRLAAIFMTGAIAAAALYAGAMQSMGDTGDLKIYGLFGGIALLGLGYAAQRRAQTTARYKRYGKDAPLYD